MDGTANNKPTAPPIEPERIAALRDAQGLWAQAGQQQRRDCFDRLIAIVLGAQREHLGEIAQEAEKSRFETASGELLPLLEVTRFLASKGIAIVDAPQTLNVRVAPHKTHRVVHKARGIVGVIAPGNFRFSIAGSEVLFALAAKNAVVLKPAPGAKPAAERLLRWLDAAGFPADLVHVTDDDDESGRRLVESDVNYITFVGSTAAGRTVGARCAARGIPFRSELGGKAAAVVLKSAPLKRTAAAIAWGTFCHDGQVCAGIQRCFVDSESIDSFCGQLVEELAHLPPRVTTEKSREQLDTRMRPFIEDALARGARELFASNGRTVLRFDNMAITDALEAQIFAKECFAPLLAVVATSDVSDAIAAVHAGPGDLIAYVFGERRNAEKIAAALRVGTVMVNDVLWSYGMPEAPWRGVQKSGAGVTHGIDGLLDYTIATHVVSPRAPMEVERDPYWYPHSEARLASLRDGMRAIYGEGIERVAASGRALWHQTRSVLNMRKGQRSDNEEKR